MAQEILTDLKLRKTVAQFGKRCELWDTKIPGFGVRIAPSGAKTFVFMYRHDDRKHRLTIGRYPDLSLSEARSAAQDLRSMVARGENPKSNANVIPDKSRFDRAVEDFVRLHCERHNRASTRKETERILKSDFVSSWHDRNVAMISRGDVLAILDGIVQSGRPSAANHALAAIRKFFNWCVERELVEVNPCVGVHRPAKVVARDRVLTDDELSALWRASTEAEYPFRQIVQLLFLSAQRRSEVAGMRWQDIDFNAGTWTIPAERNKSDRVHTVPLTEEIVDILRSVPRLSNDLVFPSRGDAPTPFSGFSKCKRRLDDALEIAPWRLHDIRRTVATGMARQGTPPHVVERLLNHASGILGGVAGIYNRHQYFDEMRLTLDAWHAHVVHLTSPSSERT